MELLGSKSTILAELWWCEFLLVILQLVEVLQLRPTDHRALTPNNYQFWRTHAAPVLRSNLMGGMFPCMQVTVENPKVIGDDKAPLLIYNPDLRRGISRMPRYMSTSTKVVGSGLRGR
jgi:hypothetical protein